MQDKIIDPNNREAVLRFLLNERDQSINLGELEERVQIPDILTSISLGQQRKQQVGNYLLELETGREFTEDELIVLEDTLYSLAQISYLTTGRPTQYDIMVSTELKYKPGSKKIWVNEKVFNHLLELLDRVRHLPNGDQLRVSSKEIFSLSVAHVVTIHNILDKDMCQYKPKHIRLAPMHEYQEILGEWDNYVQSVYTNFS